MGLEKHYNIPSLQYKHEMMEDKDTGKMSPAAHAQRKIKITY